MYFIFLFSLSELDEIKAQLEGTLGVEELQKELSKRKTRVSESHSETGSNADRVSLTGSLKRYRILLPDISKKLNLYLRTTV